MFQEKTFKVQKSKKARSENISYIKRNGSFLPQA